MIRTLPFAVIAALVAIPALAEDTPKAPDPAAMMAAMMKHAAVGPEHKVLDQLVGKWTYTAEMWMDPSKPPETMSGTTERTFILGGRFLQDKISGTAMGAPFEGLGYTGYDNAKKKYVGMWLDSWSTSIMTSEGDYDAKTKTLTSASRGYDPSVCKECLGKDVTTIHSADEHTMTFYKLVDGKEVKAMVLHAKRAK